MEDTTISVEFPLRGEWVAVQTPKEKIPSHGIEMSGQKYAMRIITGECCDFSLPIKPQIAISKNHFHKNQNDNYHLKMFDQH
jgi:hypothetical protein